MNDVDFRLAALDPAASQPYHHPDLEGMITRITSQRVKSPSSVGRRFQLRVAGAFAASALLTVGAIVALEGVGTVLPLLTLASANTSAPPGPATPFFGAMQISSEYHFSAGPELTPRTPAGRSYRIKIPTNRSAEAMRIAKVFGVTRSPLTISGGARHETITDSSGRSLDYEGTGLARWYYSLTSPPVAPATASSISSAKLPSHATLEGDVRGLLAKLGYGYTVSSPNFSSTTLSTTNANGSIPVTTSTESVTFTVEVDGFATDQRVDFSVDVRNHVSYASGPAFYVTSTSSYPLQSPVAGISALNAGQRSTFTPNSSATGTSAVGPPSAAKAGATSSTSPARPPIVQVTLSSVSLSLATYQLTNGDFWLLPVYDYRGRPDNAARDASLSQWYELAIDPRYVRISSATSSEGAHRPPGY